MNNMKQINIKEEISVTYWEACDGTRFKERIECERYDNSAKALLLSKYNSIKVKSCMESDIFGCGCDDNLIEIVKIKTQHDIDIIMQLLGIFNSFLLTDNYKDLYNKNMDFLKEAMETNDIVFIYRGYDNESFTIQGTLNSRIKEIQEACKY